MHVSTTTARCAAPPKATRRRWRRSSTSHGPEVYAFCHRLLGAAEPAADATQDAFLAATELAAEPGYDPARFRETLLRTARVASLELLGSRGGAARAGGTLSAATMRLRPSSAPRSRSWGSPG